MVHTQLQECLGCSGYGHDKTMTSDSDWKVGKGDLTHFELTDAQAAAWLPKCTAWLDYIVTLGGNLRRIYRRLNR